MSDEYPATGKYECTECGASMFQDGYGYMDSPPECYECGAEMELA